MNTMARSYVNNDARMWGGEATARWAFGRSWLLSAGLSYVRGVQDLDPLQNINDRDLPEVPPLTARAALRFDAGKWFVEGEATARAAQEFVDEDLLESRTPGWGVVNVRGGVVFQRFSILAGVANLFDHYYRENLSYQRDPFRSGVQVPEPGASFSVSVLYRY
jgi:iron complex outermembrane receptor protein